METDRILSRLALTVEAHDRGERETASPSASCSSSLRASAHLQALLLM